MSIIWSNNFGWFLCHSSYLSKIYDNLQDEEICDCKKYKIFHINSQFVRHTKKMVISDNTSRNCMNLIGTETDFRLIEVSFYENFLIFLFKLKNNKFPNIIKYAASNIFKLTRNLKDLKFFIPPHCTFYCCDINEIDKKIVNLRENLFDLILMDPPWWNKHIRRKNLNNIDEGYNLIYKEDLIKIPINRILSSDGIVVVWCTNSQQQINFLIEKIFPSWKIKYVTTWYWIKVTTNFQPICNFSIDVNKKQPFERIIFGTRRASSKKCKMLPKSKLIVSVPSSIHSHKPPLTDILEKYIPSDSQCLELFARYLVPNWISCGNEVLKLQHKSLFQ
ncbi:hypothetical protein PGB90_008076 [Kerria lacca]